MADEQQRYMPHEPVERIQYAEDGSNTSAVEAFADGEFMSGAEDRLDGDGPTFEGVVFDDGRGRDDQWVDFGQWLVKHQNGTITVHDEDPTVTLAEPTNPVIRTHDEALEKAWAEHAARIAPYPIDGGFDYPAEARGQAHRAGFEAGFLAALHQDGSE